MSTSSLFQPLAAGPLSLRNRIAMAPMTRSRALHNLPNALMADYYRQRNQAGLIITEGTSPSPEGLGYPRIPGLFDEAQQQAWAPVVAAGRAQGARMVVQLMHTGRIAHRDNLPAGRLSRWAMRPVCISCTTIRAPWARPAATTGAQACCCASSNRPGMRG